MVGLSQKGFRLLSISFIGTFEDLIQVKDICTELKLEPYITFQNRNIGQFEKTTDYVLAIKEY